MMKEKTHHCRQVRTGPYSHFLFSSFQTLDLSISCVDLAVLTTQLSVISMFVALASTQGLKVKVKFNESVKISKCTATDKITNFH